MELGSELEKGEERLKKLFESWLKKYNKDIEDDKLYTEQAKELLKEKSMHSTRKYLYTIGQILDYLYEGEEKLHEIWNKELKLIYITPDGKGLQNIIAPGWKDFYISTDDVGGCVSLREALSTLEELMKNEKYIEKNGDYAGLLISIIKELYPEQKGEKHD